MDRVKLYPQERLDLDDVRALQALSYDYTQEELGAVLGPARGVLSVPRVTVVENGGAPYMTLSPFAFVTSTPVADRGAVLPASVTEYAQHKSVVANYSASEESSAQISLDIARAYYQDSAGSWYLWARPVLLDTDTATRRKWDVASGAEVTFSDETRESQRVEFKLQAGEPAYDAATEARWAPVALLVSWSDEDNTGSVPTWRWLSAWDDDSFVTWANTFKDVSGTTSANISLRRFTENAGTEPVSGFSRLESLGLRAQLAYMRYVLSRVQGTGVNWDQEPVPVSLTSANTRITALESRQLSPVQCIASCRVGITVIQELVEGSFPELYAPPTLFSGSYGFADVTPVYLGAVGTAQNQVNIRLDPAVLAQRWTITSVQVQQIYNAQTVATGHYDLNRCTFMVPPASYGADSSDALDMVLADGSTVYRGVQVMFLPQVVAGGAPSDPHEEHVMHFPNGLTTSSMPILNDLGGSYDLIFSVAVFGVPFNQATL